MADDLPLRLPREGRTWRIGTTSDIAWIAAGTDPGLHITSAIPPVFAAYATVVVPAGPADRDEHDRAILAPLVEHSGDQPWWLGYLDTGGGADVVFPAAPRVPLYAGWSYVLVEAGPEQAVTWRTNDGPFEQSLPDLMFPADRCWLVSRLWDDDWRCIGAPRDVVATLVADPALEARPVQLGEDATPSGHVAY